METPSREFQRRVLIVSSHPLFGLGLRRLLDSRPQTDVVVIGIVESVSEAMGAIDHLRPDLIIVDYDDETVSREEVLMRFIEGGERLRIVLLSLEEDHNDIVIYDRRTLLTSKIDDWLAEWPADMGSTR